MSNPNKIKLQPGVEYVIEVQIGDNNGSPIMREVGVVQHSVDNILHFGKLSPQCNGTHVGADANGNGGVFIRNGESIVLNAALPIETDENGSFVKIKKPGVNEFYRVPVTLVS